MNNKSCFIENDFEIDEDQKRLISRKIFLALLDTLMSSETKPEFDKLFDVIITEANQKKKQVWQAINECDYIFLYTAFIGESAYLLEEMCELALKKKIRDKRIINFRDSDSYLALTERGRRMLHILGARYNVKYIAQDTEEFEEIVKFLFYEKINP